MLAVDVAEALGFVKEASNHNDGAWVEAILRVTGNKKGDPWCCSLVSFCLQIQYRGKNPFPMTASCHTLYLFAKKNGLIVTDPQRNDVGVILNSEGHAHHALFARDAAFNGKVPTQEGNTNNDGSREGWGNLSRVRTLSPSLVWIRPPKAA